LVIVIQMEVVDCMPNIIAASNVEEYAVLGRIASQHIRREPQPTNKVCVDIPPILKIPIHLRIGTPEEKTTPVCVCHGRF
jgi:hypothetical protein